MEWQRQFGARSYPRFRVAEQYGVVEVELQAAFYQLILFNLGVSLVALKFYVKSFPGCFAIEQGV